MRQDDTGLRVSRRAVLAGTGALVLSFASRDLFAQHVPPTLPNGAEAPQLPGSLQKTPLLDAWIRIDAEGRITVFTGKAELGQGIRTALIQVAAEELEVALGDQYVCNFSVFQSLLDHWALGQLFPVMPVHRLNTRPERNGTLVDITCDSDGKVSKFIDLQDVKETLPLHKLIPGEPYYIGFFLLGAYQDIMGDLHNLFGRVNEAHVFLDEDEEDGFYIEETIQGSTIGEVLSMTQWNQADLIRRFKAQVDAAIKSDRIKPNDGMKLLTAYERGLKNYTYLSVHDYHTNKK